MPCTLNKSAWEKLIDEDIDWLDFQPDTLECKHIRQILEWTKTHRPDKQTKRIKELEAQLEKHRWIPVSEKLPENIADVFILTDSGSGGVGFYGEDEKGHGWVRLDYAINLNITHWKPIISE